MRINIKCQGCRNLGSGRLVLSPSKLAKSMAASADGSRAGLISVHIVHIIKFDRILTHRYYGLCAGCSSRAFPCPPTKLSKAGGDFAKISLVTFFLGKKVTQGANPTCTNSFPAVRTLALTVTSLAQSQFFRTRQPLPQDQPAASLSRSRAPWEIALSSFRLSQGRSSIDP